MAIDAAPRPPIHHRMMGFLHDVRAEMARVTWPDAGQIRQLSIAVIALSLFIGAIIGLLDLVFQTLLVSGIPRILGR